MKTLLIQKAIAKYFKNAKLIHSGDAVVEYLKQELKFKSSKKRTNLKLFATESPETLKQVASNWLGSSGSLL